MLSCEDTPYENKTNNSMNNITKKNVGWNNKPETMDDLEHWKECDWLPWFYFMIYRVSFIYPTKNLSFSLASGPLCDLIINCGNHKRHHPDISIATFWTGYF